MKVTICANKQELGNQAAADAAVAIREAIAARGRANIIVATGASQFEVLSDLVVAADIDWSKVTAFHLDEYVGMAITHPASFRKYLEERFVSKLPKLGKFHPVNGDAPDAQAECERLSALICSLEIDVALAGIGENAHLAFNDPPADFEERAPYIVVDLDEGCRKQQLGEGWFPTLEDVPKQAISMSIQEILRSKKIIISCPDRRKAEAVRGSIEGPVTPDCPASILQRHADTAIYLDQESASLLGRPE